MGGPANRLWKVASGFGGAVAAPFGLVKDLWEAPSRDEEDYDNFVHILWARSLARGSQVVENLVGPDKGIGAAIGAVPAGVRNPISSVVTPIQNALETTGREVIREPFTTLMTVASLDDSKTYGHGQGAFLRGDTWRDAYKIAQNRSVGQSIALALGTKDILDEDEVARAMHTDFYNIVSGGFDAAFRLILDPDVLLGKTGTLARVGLIEKPILSAEESARMAKLSSKVQKADEASKLVQAADAGEKVGTLRLLQANTRLRGAGKAEQRLEELRSLAAARGETYNTSQRWAKVKTRISEIDNGLDDVPTEKRQFIKEARIRDEFLPNNDQGQTMAYVLAKAQNDADMNKAMRVFTGDFEAFADMHAERATKQAQVAGLESQLFDMGKATADANKTGQMSVFDADLQDWGLKRSMVKTTTNALDDSIGDHFFTQTPEYQEMLQTQLNDARSRIKDLDRILGTGEGTEATSTAFGALQQNPLRVSVGGRLRTTVKQSAFYQESPLSKPIRVLVENYPHTTLRVDDTASDAQIDRLWRQAGYDLTEREAARGQWISTAIEDRPKLYQQLEDQAIQKMAADYGLDTEDFLSTVRQAGVRTRDTLASAKRTVTTHGNKQATLFEDAGELIAYHKSPASMSSYDDIYMPDMKRMRQAMRRAGETKLHILDPDKFGGLSGEALDAALQQNAKLLKAIDVPKAALEGVMRVWRPFVLLRPAWPMRVVGEEQLRMMAKLDSMLEVMASKPHAFMNYSIDASNVIGRKGGAVLGGLAGYGVGGPLGAAVGAFGGQALIKQLAQMEKYGVRQLMLNGYTVAPGRDSEAIENLISAGKSHKDFLRSEGPYMTSARAGWKPQIHPDDAKYHESWANIVNGQLAQHPVAKRLMQGKSEAEIVHWLQNDPEGIKVANKVPWKSANPESWVETLSDAVHEYTAGSDPDLIAAALKGKVDVKMLQALDPSAAPILDANLVEQAMGQGHIADRVHGLINKAYEIWGKQPTDNLSRIDYFDAIYQRRMAALTARLPEASTGRVTQQMLDSLSAQARETALGETKRLLYDLAEQSDFAEMTRMIMPFFNAYQEVMTRWVGLFYENPAFVLRLRKAMNAPDQAGLVYKDDEGNEYLTLRLPEWAKGLAAAGPFRSAFDDQGYLRLPKKGFNMIAQGTPGFGPVVQIGAAQLVQEKPELEESMQWMFPFGVGSSTDPIGGALEAFAPAGMKRLMSLHKEEDDRSFMNAYKRILQTRMVNMETTGKGYVNLDDPVERDKFLADVKEETRRFMALRVVASYMSPVAPVFDSPYRDYIDEYRRLQKEDNQTAQDRFLDLHGEDYFALTQAFSKVQDGVPPTTQAEALREGPYKELIEAYPQLGSFILGEQGAGSAEAFSRAVYNKQSAQRLSPGSSRRRREPLSPEEFVQAPDIRLGWEKYTKAMDALESIRIQRKLPNMRVKAAADLQEAKTKIIFALAQEHPSWFADFNDRDTLKWQKRLQGMRAIASNPVMNGRKDIEGVGQYLQARDLITKALAARAMSGGSAQIDSASNADLAHAWDTITSRLVDTNPPFGNTFSRWLDRDPISDQSTWDPALSQLVKTTPKKSTKKVS